jgi:hypothetical protein
LHDDCAKCSDKQRQGSDKVIKFLYRNKAQDWKQLQEMYDPDNTYYNKYKDKLNDTTN